MNQSKILVDSSAYLCLATTCHPLLFREFGQPCYCLYITDDLRRELEEDSRLEPVVDWIDQPDYRKNRSRTIQLSREERALTELALQYIRAFLDADAKAVAAVDAATLACARVLNLPVVTANEQVRAAAASLGIDTWTTARLKKLLA